MPGGPRGTPLLRVAIEKIVEGGTHGVVHQHIVETIAVKSVFGEHAKEMMVSSTKSMSGHLLGAAGGFEFGVSVLAVERGVVPPTINLDEPDPENDLDYVPHTAREASIKIALTNSFGFGGTNGCLLVGAAD